MTAYTEALQSGTTTLCRCFRIIRADGVEMGFTDHDSDLAFDGLTYRAAAALTATEAASNLGLSPDEMEAHGALSHDAITEDDLSARVYDRAWVEVWDVNWRDVTVRQILGRYTIGEVERGPLAFRAELRSLSATLDQQEGRVHSTLCDARRLGDHRCRLDLASWQASATVIRITGLEITVSGLEGFNSGFFSRGIVEWATGANVGGDGEDVRISTRSGTETTLSLWRAPTRKVQVGDTLTVTAGCDRTGATCRDRFANLINFRGFMHMPGDTFLNETARQGDPDQTGGSRFA
ncbi:MAG: DUF2163 domain-containing protein [Pseudomonadota bacterium]